MCCPGHQISRSLIFFNILNTLTSSLKHPTQSSIQSRHQTQSPRCLNQSSPSNLGTCIYGPATYELHGMYNDGIRKDNQNRNVFCFVYGRLCPTLCNPMDCSLPASSVHEIIQAGILEWVAISSSRGSSWPRYQTSISSTSCSGRQILYHWTIWEAHMGYHIHI